MDLLESSVPTITTLGRVMVPAPDQDAGIAFSMGSSGPARRGHSVLARGPLGSMSPRRAADRGRAGTAPGRVPAQAHRHWASPKLRGVHRFAGTIHVPRRNRTSDTGLGNLPGVRGHQRLVHLSARPREDLSNSESGEASEDWSSRKDWCGSPGFRAGGSPSRGPD